MNKPLNTLLKPLVIACLFGITACGDSDDNNKTPTPTQTPVTPIPAIAPTPVPPTPAPTNTPAQTPSTPAVAPTTPKTTPTPTTTPTPSTSPTTPSVVYAEIKGRAAVGNAIANKPVIAKCADGSGFFSNVTTDDTGAFRGFVVDDALPCALEVVTGNTKLHSFADKEGVTNITPLTDMTVALTAKKAPKDWFAEATPNLDKTALTTATNDLLTSLRSKKYDVPAASDFSPFSTAFEIDDNADKLLDQISAEAKRKQGYDKLIDALKSGQATGLPEVKNKVFNRIASFEVCKQLDDTCNDDTETSAEIVAATMDGNTLVYTDSPMKNIGFVDITDAKKPMKKGTFAVGGEPTSVYIKGNYALVGVNTSASFTSPSGMLKVIDIAQTMTKKQLVTVASIDLKGQPDSVAISPDGKYAAVAIENERDEDLTSVDGGLPQLPAGKLVIINTSDADASKWTSKDVALTGLAGMLENTDPEPEYVDFNRKNEILVTMQENNHIAIVDAKTGTVTKHFTAGKVTLQNVDKKEEKPRLVTLDKELKDVPREPDGATWINDDYFATANEGDWKGGSRGFSIFKKDGTVAYDSGNKLDHMAVKLGHYPEKRSANKGNEPENAEYGKYGADKFLFVASERASLIFVYDVENPMMPAYKQTLPAGVGPEGVLAIPSRNLLIAASEVDARDDKIRSVLNIYEYAEAEKPMYPTLKSSMVDNKPIAWGAMSGLAVSSNGLYAINDSFYGKNSIFKIDATSMPAMINKAMPIKDANDKMANHPNDKIKGLVNSDKTINIDPEGIAIAQSGGFWIASEGSGTVGDKKKPYKFPNLLLKTDANADITEVITLPKALNDVQLRFGFEGVAEDGDKVYVAFQRAWNKEANPRIGIYDTTKKTWSFVYYPLDTKASQNGGWVGLSDLAPLGNGKFAVLERDNQGGPDAAIKRIYEIDLSNVKANETITKTLKRDLIAKGDLTSMGNLPYEKVEGLTVDANGNAWIINDNDGVDDNSGETMLKNLGKLF